MVQVDTRPPGLNVLFRPGATLTVELTWPAGSLTGRTFSSTLSGAALGLSVAGDVMTITATVAQTSAATQPADWVLVETIAGVDEPIMIGEWHPSDDAGTAARTVTVSQGSVSVAVATLAGTPTPRILRVSPRSTQLTWTESVFTTDAGVLDATAITFEHGQVVIRGSGAGTGVRSNRRSVYKIPGSPGGYSRIRSRWTGKAYSGASGLTPQRGHGHGVGTQSDGKRRGVMVTHDIVFSALWVFNLAIWEANADGTGFSQLAGVTQADQINVTAAARTTNVVTLTVPSGHGFAADDVITVDLADNSYDGTFVVTSVTPTTIVYSQTAANAGTTTGTLYLTRAFGQKPALVRTVSATDAVRTSGLVTATVPANHPFQKGDWIDVDFADNTYDGQFEITDLPTSTQIQWRQAVADDASAGAGTISKTAPFWVESEWRPGLLMVRVWPDVGMTGSGGTMPGGPPPWESAWAIPGNLSGAATQPDPVRGQGCFLVGAHLSSLPTELRYDSVECEGLIV